MIKHGSNYLQPKPIILIGPPGSGKGTQAACISPALGTPAISTGDMLRRECQSGSSLGRAVQAILASGQLVSDELMNQVIAARLRQLDCQPGFILDGYPRTVAQARFLSRLLKDLHQPDPVVFHFDIASEDVIARLVRRLQCGQCGRSFTANSASSDGEMRCDKDGSKLVHRADDNATSIRQRLALYQENAAPLLRFYRSRGDYHRIEANRAASEIANELLSILRARPSSSVLPGQARAAAQSSQYVQ